MQKALQANTELHNGIMIEGGEFSNSGIKQQTFNNSGNDMNSGYS
jgi:hypothetical protein